MHKKQSQLNRGFSLIEIIVSLGIFMIVAVIATGTLLKIVDAGNKAQATKAVVNNLQFALESMSREIRTGKKFHCRTAANPSTSVDITVPLSCPNGSNTNVYLAFEPAVSRGGQNNTDRFAYQFANGRIQKSDSNDGGIRNFYDITAPEVIVEDMRFVVSGAETGAANQDPTKIIIIIKGYVEGKARTRSDFSMQTTVTPRIRE